MIRLISEITLYLLFVSIYSTLSFLLETMFLKKPSFEKFKIYPFLEIFDYQ